MEDTEVTDYFSYIPLMLILIWRHSLNLDKLGIKSYDVLMILDKKGQNKEDFIPRLTNELSNIHFIHCFQCLIRFNMTI